MILVHLYLIQQLYLLTQHIKLCINRKKLTYIIIGIQLIGAGRPTSMKLTPVEEAMLNSFEVETVDGRNVQETQSAGKLLSWSL